MRQVILDLETDGLLEELTRIHCLVLRDIDTNEVMSCADQPGYPSIAEGLEAVKQAEKIYGHNLIGFDVPALKKVTGYDIPKEKVVDTLVTCQMRWAHIKELDFSNARKGKMPQHLAGKHSLEAWGYRIGRLKGTYGKTSDWRIWSKAMQDYCEVDTDVNRELVFYIRKHGVSPEAVRIEHALAWYLRQQERNGWPFDVEKAHALQAKLAARREEVSTELKRVFGSWYASNGETTPKRDNKKQGITAGCPYTKIKLVEFNPGSRQHIAQRLTKLYGWKPEEFTPSGQAEVNEKTLKSLDQTLPGVKLLSEYLLLDKRLGQLAEGKEAWLKRVTADQPLGGKLTGLSHIHGRCLQNATITHRAAHSNPNIAQVPKNKSPFGAECRDLFHVPAGWIQIGADASSLEARCLGHYMAKYDGGVYAEKLLKGDVHTENKRVLGLDNDPKGRDTAKVWLYAFMYGAGDEKLGSIHSPGIGPASQKSLGKRLKKQYLASLPALARLTSEVKAVAQQGWLRGIDGRRVYVRSDHSSLNTLLQSAGALICKAWIVNFSARFEAEFGPQGWLGQWAALSWVHDEVQIAVRPAIETRAKQILLEEMRALTQTFQWRVALDGEAKSGRSWKETH